MAGAIADAATRISRAFGRAYQNAQGMDVPGAPLHVSPFRPGEVTGEGVAIKALAGLMAGRRAAANQRLINETRATRAAHEAMLTKQLEDKLNPETMDVTTPAGEHMKLTQPQYLSHYSVFHPKATVPTGRIHVTPQEAADLQVPFDPETGTAASGDVHFAWAKKQAAEAEAWRKKVAAGVESRFDRAQDATQRRFDTSQGGVADRAAAQRESASWTQLMTNLDKRETEVEQDAIARGLASGAAAQRVLQDPNQSVTLRTKAARGLGVGYARNPADGTILRDPATGAPMYDLTGLEGKVKDFATRQGKRARQRVSAMNATDRLYYAQRLHEATGRFTGQPAAQAAPAPAAGIQFDADESAYLRALGIPLPEPEPAAEDTSWYDKPAVP